jgi:hypothetical protein
MKRKRGWERTRDQNSMGRQLSLANLKGKKHTGMSFSAKLVRTATTTPLEWRDSYLNYHLLRTLLAELQKVSRPLAEERTSVTAAATAPHWDPHALEHRMRAMFWSEFGTNAARVQRAYDAILEELKLCFAECVNLLRYAKDEYAEGLCERLLQGYDDDGAIEEPVLAAPSPTAAATSESATATVPVSASPITAVTAFDYQLISADALARAKPLVIGNKATARQKAAAVAAAFV